MLELTVFDTDSGRNRVLKFEHSLRSISKWEKKYKKPFLSKQHTALEMIDYFRCMLLNKKADPNLVVLLSPEQMEALGNYINESQTASSVPAENNKSRNEEVVTSELIYYWMTELGIAWEAQDWHYSRLSMLIQITNYKKQPPKKQSVRSFKENWQAHNERARKRFNSNG